LKARADPFWPLWHESERAKPKRAPRVFNNMKSDFIKVYGKKAWEDWQKRLDERQPTESSKEIEEGWGDKEERTERFLREPHMWRNFDRIIDAERDMAQTINEHPVGTHPVEAPVDASGRWVNFVGVRGRDA